MTGMSTLELAVRNLSWMSGNLFLAWSAVLFALHLRGTPRQQRVAAVLLVTCATLMLAARLMVRGAAIEYPTRSVATVLLVGVAAVAWSVLARRGNRPARAIGYLGVLAFAPNAPYILTDLFHHVQDVRYAAFGAVASVVFAVQYGWFLVAGAASWIVLLALARDWLRRHRPDTSPALPYIVVCGVMAFGIYLGRIERFHSWHPLAEPGRFLDRIGIALTSPGPIVFTLAWWAVVLVAGVAGLRLADRARAAGSSPWSLVVALSWLVSGALLVATPLVSGAFGVVGVQVFDQSRAASIGCVLVGSTIAVLAGVALGRVLARERHHRHRRLAAWAVVAALLVPVAGAALTAASIAQWYAQFRGLCEYSPNPVLHGDACVD